MKFSTPNDIKISIIVAAAQNGVIGKNNDMPWHIPQDFKRFKRITMGHPVIMGRKTYESIYNRLGKPLPGRDNIIITRQTDFNQNAITHHDRVHICTDIEQAIALGKDIAANQKLKEVFIIGGAQIYKKTINIVDRIHLTEVLQSVDGDAFFPSFDKTKWSIRQEPSPEDDCQSPPYRFITLDRA